MSGPPIFIGKAPTIISDLDSPIRGPDTVTSGSPSIMDTRDAINAGMETISCGPETDASKTYMIVSSFHTSFLAAEISISAAEKTGGAVPLCALTRSLGNPTGIRAGRDRRGGSLAFQ